MSPVCVRVLSAGVMSPVCVRVLSAGVMSPVCVRVLSAGVMTPVCVRVLSAGVMSPVFVRVSEPQPGVRSLNDRRKLHLLDLMYKRKDQAKYIEERGLPTIEATGASS